MCTYMHIHTTDQCNCYMYVTLSLVILNCNIFRLLATNVTSVKNNRAVVIAILDNIIFLNYILRQKVLVTRLSISHD